MNTGLYGRHNLHAFLHDGKCGSYRSLIAHFTYLHIRLCGESPSFVNDIAEQGIENLTGFLVGEK